MDYLAIWNEFCFHIRKSHNASERDFQTTMEFLFDKLGWSLYKGEIVSQKIIPVGSSYNVKPDIIIKSKEQVILVVELKKPSAIISERNADQLKSYMRLLKLDFGIMLGETFQMYYEIAEERDSPIKVIDIPFIDDLQEGADCIKQLVKNEYSFDNLNKYCLDSLTEINEVEKLNDYISLLCSDNGSEIVAEMLASKLLSEFSEKATSLIMDSVSISISRKEGFKFTTLPVSPDVTTDFNSKRQEKGKITREMVDCIWNEFRLRRNQGNNHWKEAAKKISNETQMNNGSAFIYFNILSNLLDGKFNSRNMKLDDLEYYIERIITDYPNYIQNTIISLEASIPYWEEKIPGNYYLKVQELVTSYKKLR